MFMLDFILIVIIEKKNVVIWNLYIFFTENLQVTKECKTDDQNGNISICETSDIKLGDSYEDKEDFLLKLNVDDENIQILDEESMLIVIYLFYLWAQSIVN